MTPPIAFEARQLPQFLLAARRDPPPIVGASPMAVAFDFDNTRRMVTRAQGIA
jgi:hypothetical protein